MFGAFDLDKEWPSGIATVNPCLMSVIVNQNDDVVNKTKQDTDRTRSLFFIFFLYFRLFNTVESKQMFNIIFVADDWIRTADLWCQKGPLYQMSHHYYPTSPLFPQIFFSYLTFALVRFWI